MWLCIRAAGIGMRLRQTEAHVGYTQKYTIVWVGIQGANEGVV